MNITVTGRHMDLTDALKAYVEDGLEKIRHHFDRVIDVDVILGVEKHRQTAEFNVHANHLRINAKETSEDMYASIDAALNKVDRQIRKHKGRIMRHTPHSRKEAASVHEDLEAAATLDGAQTATEQAPEQEIYHEHVAPLTMTVDEAAFHLSLTDEPVFMFINLDTKSVNAIYKRDDGHFSVLEPQS